MSIYKKFSPEQISSLREILDSSNFYPTKKKMRKFAKSMKLPILKIENWFKYNRRKMYFKGKFGEYKLRKSFKKSELTHLKSLYEHNSSPSFLECAQISKGLAGITTEQVKNWFANQRRKIKSVLTPRTDSKFEIRRIETEEKENEESGTSQKMEIPNERKKLDDFIKFEKEEQFPVQQMKIDLAKNNQMLLDR